MIPIRLHNHDSIPRTIWFLILYFLTLLSVSTNSYSQNYFSGMHRPKGPEGISYLLRNEVNHRACRHFMDHFLNDGSEKWVQQNGVYTASFTAAGVKNKVYYNSKGDFQFSIRSYSSEALNKNIKASILQKFDGYQIKFVQEITNLEKQVYLIKIVNRSNIKTLEYADGVIRVSETLVNGGI